MHLLLMKLPVSILNKDIAQMYQFVALSIVTFDRPCKYSSLSLSEQCFDLRLPGENSPFAIIINDGDEALKFCNASYKSMARFIKFNDEDVQWLKRSFMISCISYYLFRINNTMLRVINNFVKI